MNMFLAYFNLFITESQIKFFDFVTVYLITFMMIWKQCQQLLTQNLRIFTINKENYKIMYFPFLTSHLFLLNYRYILLIIKNYIHFKYSIINLKHMHCNKKINLYKKIK